jgi:hypothetical protein
LNLEPLLKNSEIMNAANMRLAMLLGWTNLFAAGGALLGTPPAGAPSCRGQAPVPNWCGDWGAAGPLLGAYGIRLGWVHEDMSARGGVNTRRCTEHFVEAQADHQCSDDALRMVVVRAASAALEQRQ